MESCSDGRAKKESSASKWPRGSVFMTSRKLESSRVSRQMSGSIVLLVVRCSERDAASDGKMAGLLSLHESLRSSLPIEAAILCNQPKGS